MITVITNYEIRKENNEEILYLSFDFSDEFGKFNFKENVQKLEQIVKSFIEQHQLDFKGTKIAIVIGGVAVGTLLLNDALPSTEHLKLNNSNIEIMENVKNLPILGSMNYLDEIDNRIIEDVNSSTIDQNEISIEQEKKEDEINTSAEVFNPNFTVPIENIQNNEIEEDRENNNSETQIKEEQNDAPVVEEPSKIEEQPIIPEENKTYVTVYRTNGTIITLELEEYVIGVVGAEMPASFHEQALMAQAVIARTYALKSLENNKALTDNSSTQNYKDNNELKAVWGADYNFYYSKIKSAVDSTKGMYLTYNDKIIDAVYHSTSNGYTEDAKNVWGNAFPYLVSVESPYDSTNKNFETQKFLTYEEISSKLQSSITQETNFNILSYTSGNRVENIEIGGNVYTGIQVRSLLGLRSADFQIEKSDIGLIFTTKGYGHGVGMSQYGANGMAKNGYSFEQILTHYYKGVTIYHL